MSKPMIVRQLTLAQSMVDAWKRHGGWFPKRERPTESKLNLAIEMGRVNDPIINLGDMSFAPSNNMLMDMGFNVDLFYNRPASVRKLTKPGPARTLVGEFMPPDPREGFVSEREYSWIKAPGQHGQGKVRMPTREAVGTEIPTDWDMQVEVTGQEYRVITVGTKVVQVNERHGENGDRSYLWVGVTNAPTSVKEIAREAARRLEDERTIIGWDVIQGEAINSTYILEGNTCPGTNEALVGRIMAQVEGQSYAR